jgi:hypothetical protein
VQRDLGIGVQAGNQIVAVGQDFCGQGSCGIISFFFSFSVSSFLLFWGLTILCEIYRADGDY